MRELFRLNEEDNDENVCILQIYFAVAVVNSFVCDTCTNAFTDNFCVRFVGLSQNSCSLCCCAPFFLFVCPHSSLFRSHLDNKTRDLKKSTKYQGNKNHTKQCTTRSLHVCVGVCECVCFCISHSQAIEKASCHHHHLKGCVGFFSFSFVCLFFFGSCVMRNFFITPRSARR